MAMRPIGIVGRIFLARLLTPSDFGAVALAMLFVGSSYLFVGLGMAPAIIHSDVERRKLAFHAFVITTVSSVTISLFALANSAWLAELLGDPEIEPILRVLLLNLVLNAWTLVPAALLRKDLKFGAVAKSDLLSRITYLIIALVLALLGFGVWSLVIANVAQSVVALIVIWWASPNWDWLKPVPWDWAVFKGLLRYGSQTTASGVVRYFATNWDDWLVGRQLGTESLGFYNKAYDFTNNTIRQFGNSVVGGVFFPAYAKINNNLQRLQRAYLKSIQLVSTIMFPIALGFLATASLLIPVVLGEKWAPMIETFQVFSVLVLTRPISANASSVFRAVGKPRFNMYAALLLSAIMVPIALLLIEPYGIVGVAAAVLIADSISMFYNIYLTNRVLPGSARKSFRYSLPALAAALIMFVTVVISQNYLVSTIGANIWSLGAAILIGVVVYGLAIFAFQREFTKDVLSTAVTALDKQGRLEKFIAKHKPA